MVFIRVVYFDEFVEALFVVGGALFQAEDLIRCWESRGVCGP